MSNDNLKQSYADLLETIKQDGLQLKQIPKREQTLDICQIAVAQNPLALKHVSVKFRSEEMCSSAVERNPQAFRYVPESLRNRHIISFRQKSRPHAVFKHFNTRSCQTPELSFCINFAFFRRISHLMPCIMQFYNKSLFPGKGKKLQKNA